MNEITRNEFLASLKAYHPPVQCESYLIYAMNFRPHDAAVKYYRTDGCAVFCHSCDCGGTYRIECCIHEISDDCDLPEAYRTCETMTASELVKHDRCERRFALLHCGALPFPDVLNNLPGTYRFARIAEEPEGIPDPHVCVLTKKDYADIRAMCDPALLQNDSRFARNEAHTFFRCFSSWEYADGYVKLLGFRDDRGNLTGIASWSMQDTFNLCCCLRDIFVSREGRGHGVGKALVRAAMANAPGKEWLYQANRENKASIALAESLGFTLAGARLEVIL